jgi:hypothetical protein
MNRWVVIVLLGLSSCKRSTTGAVQAVDASGDASEEAGTVREARCALVESGVVLAEGTEAADLEIGEAVEETDGIAVGVLRRSGGALVAGVSRVRGGTQRFVPLGAPLGDAPPPRPFVTRAGLFAAFYGRPSKPTGTRALTFVRFSGEQPSPVYTLAEQNDDSMAFDVAFGDRSGVFAWDEDAIGLRRGNVKVVVLSPEGKELRGPRIASPDDTDAERPRVVARRGGFWLVWVARRLEGDEGRDGGHRDEAPALRRAFEWLEVVALDEGGEAAGPVRRLTSVKGHVSVFDLAVRVGTDTVDIVARDDDQAVDGAGGRLVRVSVRPDGVEGPTAIVAEVGRGVPDFLVLGTSTWLFFTEPSDRLRLIPLDAARIPAASPSLEKALDRGRPLVRLSGRGESRLLAAFPEDASGQLRTLSCGL